MSTAAGFSADLKNFGIEVEADARRVFHAAAEDVAEAIVIGNRYGPGVPTDTGFLRSSFRVGIGAPAAGPSRTLGNGIPGSFPAAVLGPAILRAPLDQPLFITTNVDYAEYLQFLPLTRRFGPSQGQSTVFLRPVESRWDNIVLDNMRRLGIGDAGASAT